MGEMKKCFFLAIWLLLLFYARADSRTVSPPESVAISRFAAYYESIATIEGSPPKSWGELAEYDENLEGFQSYFLEGKIDMLYSFIPEEDRSKFPDGELILIRYEPADWPRVWRHSLPKIDPEELTAEQQANLERSVDRERPIRYLVYRTESGDIRSDWWYETDVQAMLDEAGIRVPEPTPYRPPAAVSEEIASDPEALDIAEVRPQSASTQPEETATTVHEEQHVQPTEIESFKWWLWLLGILAVLCGLGVMLRRRKHRETS